MKFKDYLKEKKKDIDTKKMKYCKKHKLKYYAYLHECPICAGEKMKATHKPKKGKKETKWVDRIKYYGKI